MWQAGQAIWPLAVSIFNAEQILAVTAFRNRNAALTNAEKRCENIDQAVGSVNE
jgi:hypothetical protein